MSFWLLIIVMFTAEGEMRDVYYLDDFTTYDACMKAQTKVLGDAPEPSRMWCFPVTTKKRLQVST